MLRARTSLGRSLPLCPLLAPPLVWMILLLNSFSLVPLLVGICAEMDEISFVLIELVAAAARDLRRDG